MADMFDLDRRTMLGSIAALLGAASLPVDALAKPIRRGSGRAARFLAAPHYALLGAVADTIMPATDTPGALAAKVPSRIDGLLRNWASAETRSQVTGALDRIEAAAHAQKGKGFAALTPAEREGVLRPHDMAALQKVPTPPGTKSGNPFAPVISVADNGYYKLKELVVHLYYFSEVASTTELNYVHVPGKFVPSIKLTPTSRPELGTGPF